MPPLPRKEYILLESSMISSKVKVFTWKNFFRGVIGVTSAMLIRIFFYKYFNIDLLAYIHDHAIINHLIGLSYGISNFFIGLWSGELFTKFVSLIVKEETTHFLGIPLGLDKWKKDFFSFNLDSSKMKMGPSECTYTNGIKEIRPSNVNLKGSSKGNEGQSDLTEENLESHNSRFESNNSRGSNSSLPSSGSEYREHEFDSRKRAPREHNMLSKGEIKKRK